MADYRKILVLLLEGRSYREVVEIAGCSHRDVARVRQEVQERGLTSAVAVSDTELAQWFPDGRRKVSEEYFLTVGIDSDAANDLFAVLANREHRLPTMIASQTGPAHWVAELPDRVAADSIVNRLANNARIINLGQIDMRRHRNDQARAHEAYWE